MESVSTSAITRLTLQHNLPNGLLAALIQVESGGDASAWRVEPAYRYLWDVKNRKPFRKLSAAETYSCIAPDDFKSLKGSADTEWMGQKSSWGPCQIMGGVARELGFTGHFPDLCGELGLAYSAKHLANYASRYYGQHGWDGVIAAYNAGSPRYLNGLFANQTYVNKVKAVWRP